MSRLRRCSTRVATDPNPETRPHAWSSHVSAVACNCPSEIRRLRASLGVTHDPFSHRLRTKLREVLTMDPELTALWTHPGRVLGADCPPVAQLLGKISRWTVRRKQRRGLALLHGDPHIGNILVRARPRSLSVRLIDPNTTVGFSDPAYDYGKLLHFLEPVGWCRARPDLCDSRWRFSRGSGGSGRPIEA